MAMQPLTRRRFIDTAAALAATLAWADARGAKPQRWSEVPERYAEGVASGDPAPDSVLLWTRVSTAAGSAVVPVTVEVAEDPKFDAIVASASTRALAAADHTCRVLVAGL